VLAADLVDGEHALPLQPRQDPTQEEIAIPVDGRLASVAQPQLGEPVLESMFK
jgi:hypothetical protein